MSGERVLIGLGANLGRPAEQVERAFAALAALPGMELTERSSIWRTAPIGGPAGQSDYANAVAVGTFARGAEALLSACQGIEAALGRDRREEQHHGPRAIDLDLLEFGAVESAGPRLKLPHPLLEERAFVLRPLVEVRPDWRLPSGRCPEEALALLEPERVELWGAGVAERPEIEVLETPAGAAAWCAGARGAGARIGLVPTMGALHEGHLTLVQRAAEENDVVVASVFVNPLQFDERKDLDAYPRDLARDAELLSGAGCGMVFTGTLEGFFPEAPMPEAIAMEDPGSAAQGLEGEFRTGHFEGVATICRRLFELVRPAAAYFGEKDFQQTRVVRDLAERLGFPGIVVVPTSRDDDGLARSSRNARLDGPSRARALGLPRALFAARAAWVAGERGRVPLECVLSAELEGLEVEYAAVRDPRRLAETPGRLDQAQALIAARVGGVRLIDNLRLDAN